MRAYLALMLVTLSTPLLANIITNPVKPVIGINASEVAKRVCYYQDQAYSDGAIIQVGDYYMTCSSANDFEKNGALKWHAVKTDQQVSSDSPHTKAVKKYSTN